jgi:hypothetical protein
MFHNPIDMKISIFFAVFFIFYFGISSCNNSSSMWINNERCNEFYTDTILDISMSLIGLRRCQDTGERHENCDLTVHSCSKLDSHKFNHINLLPLEWHNKNFTTRLEELWRKLYIKLSGQKIAFIGDSLSKQTVVALTAYLLRLGYSVRDGMFSNGLCLNLTYITKYEEQKLRTSIESSNISIVNAGMWMVGE